jgi:hypothetical protein
MSQRSEPRLDMLRFDDRGERLAAVTDYPERAIAMGRRKTLTAMLTGGVLVVGVGSPAYASEISNIYCELQPYGRNTRFLVTAIAYYNDNVDGPGIRRWYEFRYRLSLTGVHRGTKNNVNIRVSENGDTVYALNSPDNREADIWYIVRPASPVHTCVWGPGGEHDHRANDLIEFKAIFDVPQGGDRACTAWVKK